MYVGVLLAAICVELASGVISGMCVTSFTSRCKFYYTDFL